MEVFSTLPRASVPWMVNALTLSVLAAATWWSADQRPAPAQAPTYRLSVASTAGEFNKPSIARATPQTLPATADVSLAAAAAPRVAGWSETTRQPESVRPVSYLTEQRP